MTVRVRAAAGAELRNRDFRLYSSPQSLHVLGFATGVNTAIDYDYDDTNFNYTKCARNCY